ncbi:MAG: phage portal protein [Clostridiales bacterium]|jgi:HK97 family phage portal protein|nr:phage portal protein [Clostridiales bacterium]
MSIFTKIFGKEQPPDTKISRAELLSGGNVFTAWSGDAYANDIYRGAVDAIARNAAKLKGSHIIKYADHERLDGDCKLNHLLQIEPNPYMSVFDLLYKLITHYFLFNNAFAYLQRDEKALLTGIFPLSPLHVDFESDQLDTLFCRFLFTGGKEFILPYSDILHLRRNFNSNDLLGDLNLALSPALQLAHTQNEGLVNAIKSSANIRGILKTPQMTKMEDLKAQQELFTSTYLNISNNGGVAALGGQFDYIPLNNTPYPIDSQLLQTVKTKIYDYLGISESIVNSSYNEDQWAAFYESTLEPIAVQLSLEFTRKCFNDRERAFGNLIHFESGRVQYSSNTTKVTMLKELIPMGLLTINQALEILNLPAVEGGDKRIMSLNFIDTAIANEYQLQYNGNKLLPKSQQETKEGVSQVEGV